MHTFQYGLLFLGLLSTSLISADKINPILQAQLDAVQMKPGEKTPAQIRAAAVDRSAWTVTADSSQDGTPPQNAIDDDPNTFWVSQWNPVLPLPHNITVDMKTILNVNAILLTPRQDGIPNGNIGRHRIQLSTDGKTWTTVAYGIYLDDSEVKTTPFQTRPARYFRIVCLTEAGNRGPWSAIADLNINTGDLYTGNPAQVGSWGQTIEFPLVPISAQVIPSSGQLLVWSSYLPNQFTGQTTGQTQSAYYDPATKLISQVTISNTGHDMFCPGTSLDASGGVVVTGGNVVVATSKYSTSSKSWSRMADMNIPRGYQSQATLSDGRIFTIGGSWSGGYGNKNGEIYSVKNNVWTLLPGCPVAPMLTADAGGVYRADNHAWLFAWKNNYVLQAGPSRAMNWYSVSGSGGQLPAGNRGSDSDSMCGNAVMFDAVNGKVLTAGGSPSYTDTYATANANIITIGAPPNAPSVQQVASMTYPRTFANGIVLPNGQVFVVGGQSYGVPFVDDNAVLIPEIFSPATNSWTSVAPISQARVYHSMAILMPDATVFSGGGGLCGDCAANHRDGQFYSPPYLFTSSGAPASRPKITSVSATRVKNGGSFNINTDRATVSFSLIRYASTTHTINTDQRRIPLTPTSTSGTTYTFTVPSDAGIAVPGAYMVFAMDSAGVPSVAKTITVYN